MRDRGVDDDQILLAVAKRTPIEATQMEMRAVLEREGFGFPVSLDDAGGTYASGITFSKPVESNES
jgi:EAL domain-containing protein (putative c-di-GMP-specific phosphodiesterase class I)